jgi:adenylosuccinate lyase
VLDPRAYIGRAPEQVDAFLQRDIEPIRRRYPDRLDRRSELHV